MLCIIYMYIHIHDIENQHGVLATYGQSNYNHEYIDAIGCVFVCAPVSAQTVHYKTSK